MFIAIFFVAISAVALLYANEYWAAAARSMLRLSLPLGLVVAIASTGNTRMFWLGFSVVGIGIVFEFGTLATSDRQYSLANQAIEWLYPRILRHTTIEVPAMGYDGVPGTTVQKHVTFPYIEHFRVVADCLVVAWSGAIGGSVAVWVYSRRDRLIK